jgi:beta-ureidopropionase
MKRKGAEIVFWTSAYAGGIPLQVYAFLHHYFVVSSTHIDARLIDLTGEIIGRAGRANPVVNAQIDLAKEIFHGDFNWMQMSPFRARYDRDVLVRILHDEALVTIESQREGLTLDDIIEEMGLAILSDYVVRNERAQDALREGRTPMVQRPPYLDRQQYLA